MNHRQRKKMLWTTDYWRRFDILHRLELRNQRLAGRVNKRTQRQPQTELRDRPVEEIHAHLFRRLNQPTSFRETDYTLGPELLYGVQLRSHRGFIGANLVD